MREGNGDHEGMQEQCNCDKRNAEGDIMADRRSDWSVSAYVRESNDRNSYEMLSGNKGFRRSKRLRAVAIFDGEKMKTVGLDAWAARRRRSEEVVSKGCDG